jgi:hypothetical protein
MRRWPVGTTPSDVVVVVMAGKVSTEVTVVVSAEIEVVDVIAVCKVGSGNVSVAEMVAYVNSVVAVSTTVERSVTMDSIEVEISDPVAIFVTLD